MRLYLLSLILFLIAGDISAMCCKPKASEKKVHCCFCSKSLGRKSDKDFEAKCASCTSSQVSSDNVHNVCIACCKQAQLKFPHYKRCTLCELSLEEKYILVQLLKPRPLPFSPTDLIPFGGW